MYINHVNEFISHRWLSSKKKNTTGNSIILKIADSHGENLGTDISEMSTPIK